MTATAPTRTGLQYFKVEGLHRRQDVGIIMPGPVGIFISDNGSGKTTALYMLQCILKGNFAKLAKFEYQRIIIKFLDHSEFILTPKDYEESRGVAAFRRIMERTNLSPNQVFRLANMARHFPLNRLREESLFSSAARHMRMPTAAFYDRLLRIEVRERDGDLVDLAESSQLARLARYIKENFTHSVLYLPTYRRVEQDAEELLEIDEDEADFSSLDIHFGMKDVDDRIKTATSQIRDHFITAYGQISGQMLGQLADNTPVSDEMRNRLLDRGNIEMALGRVAENVSGTQRELILKLYDEGTLLENGHLSFFLSSLIEAYEQVKSVDMSLKRYAEVCNGYLINKEMRYDNLNATVAVYETVGGTELKLETLSSGEKQILGVMSQLYLGEDKSYAVIFDEPELSLSMDWQKKILVDVSASEKTGMLIAVTHSPFIFENELDAYAGALEVSFHSPRED